MRYQGYLEIKFKSMTDEELSNFQANLKETGVDFYRVDTGDSEYYHCLIEDISLLESLLDSLSGRSPVLNGVWDKNGIPKGKVKNEETGEVTGDADYSFNLSKHLNHSKKIDDKGNKTTMTEFTPLHQYYGWVSPTEY